MIWWIMESKWHTQTYMQEYYKNKVKELGLNVKKTKNMIKMKRRKCGGERRLQQRKEILNG